MPPPSEQVAPRVTSVFGSATPSKRRAVYLPQGSAASVLVPFTDEVGDPHGLRLRTWVNGDLRQDSSTKHLIFDCFALIDLGSRASAPLTR
jgi:2-keto-4-pentenoate hydratase/2-oxohepta-3-ene-1,7-dioic acid hydratase in catechol pathway